MNKHLSSYLAVVALLAVFVGLALPGCSVFSTIGGWFSQGYENTTAYFNAYYNAKSIFDEAEAEVLNAPQTPQARLNQTAQTGQIPPGAKAKFNQVIDKCSHILSFYRESAVVDDALLLIGKAYYYQGEYVKAERKFSELLAQFPNGSLRLIGQLWFLKTLEKLNRSDDAITAGEALARDAVEVGEEDIAGEAHLIMASIYGTQNLPARAIAQNEEAIKVADDGLLRAQAQVRIGDLYNAMPDYEKAGAAYLRVTEYSSDTYLVYYSRSQAALALRSLGRFDAAIALLNELAEDYRFNEYIGMVRFELGQTYRLAGRTADALHEYQYVDTIFARTETGARAAFELGKLLQDEFGDYRQARVAFSHAAASVQLPLTADASRRMNALAKYFQLQEEFNKADSVFFALDIDSLWTRRDTLRVTQSQDSVAAMVDTLVSVVDSTIARNDSSGIAAAADTSLAAPDSIRIVTYKPSRDSLIAVLSGAAFQLGETFYADLEIPDSAFFWYSQSLKLRVDSTRAPRILFVLAEIMREDSLKRYGDEKEMYSRVLKEYPASTYAQQARIALGYQPAATTIDPAIALYAQAESLMLGKQYERSLESLRSIVQQYPASPLAARSRYAMGWIYENYLTNADSALSQYKQVADRYGSSVYGEAAKRRLPPPSAPDSAAAPADTTLRVPGQQPAQPPPERDARLEDKEMPRKAAADSTRATRGKRKVIID